MIDTKSKREYLSNIAPYLQELGMLADITVSKDDLSAVEEVEKIRSATSKLESLQTSKFKIEFSEKESLRFANYIQNIYNANDEQVYLWTSRTNTCGLYKVDSIKHVNFSFPFEINEEGLVVLLTSDVNDKMLLDFTIDVGSKKTIEVETQGLNWPHVRF